MKAEVKEEFVPGMYGQDDPRCPKVRVGRFILSRNSDNTVWIEDTVAEDAGAFPDSLLEAHLLKFYTEHF